MSSRYWLVKSEPDVYSIDDLERDGTTFWNGVRNYSARNHMKDGMRVGDRVLYYHSGANPPAVVGIAEVVREAYPDHTQFEPESDYHDPKATREKPRWFMVDLGFVAKLDRVVTLPEIKATKALSDMVLVNRSRLSVQPVAKAEYDLILKMAKE